MDVLNLFFRIPGIGVAEPDVGGQKVLLVKQDHAVAKSMMKVIPEKVAEQLGLLGVIDKSKTGEIVQYVLVELTDNIASRAGRLAFILSSSPGNLQEEQGYAIEEGQYVISILHNDS